MGPIATVAPGGGSGSNMGVDGQRSSSKDGVPPPPPAAPGLATPTEIPYMLISLESKMLAKMEERAKATQEAVAAAMAVQIEAEGQKTVSALGTIMGEEIQNINKNSMTKSGNSTDVFTLRTYLFLSLYKWIYLIFLF